MTRPSFLERLASGAVLMADGSTGATLQSRGLPPGMVPEQWVLDAPDQIIRLHRDFVAAGADIILTCTFGGSGIRLQHAGLRERAAEISRRAAALARQAVEGTDVLVAGSIGPTGELLEPYGDLGRADAVAAFAEQAAALIEGGVDLLLVETMFDLGEAAAAVEAARSVGRVPVVSSFSFNMGTRTMMGLDPARAAREMTALGVDAVGLNCGQSLDDNLKALEEMRAATDLPLWMKPNAGMPRVTPEGATVFDVTPAAMGEHARRWVAAGARVLGGCCGTSPDHLRAIAQAVR